MALVIALLVMFALTLDHPLIVGPLILACLVYYAVKWSVVGRRRERDRLRCANIDLAEEADRQHMAALRGDPYGMFGRHMPAKEFLPGTYRPVIPPKKRTSRRAIENSPT